MTVYAMFQNAVAPGPPTFVDFGVVSVWSLHNFGRSGAKEWRHALDIMQVKPI